MNTWYQIWGKTYQCQISNAGEWFISVRFSKFQDFSMTFDDFSKFHDFPWLFQKILFFQVFQVFQTLWEPCLKVFLQVNSLALWHLNEILQLQNFSRKFQCWGLLMNICISELCLDWFGKCLLGYEAQSFYLNWCWLNNNCQLIGHLWN